ncbi:phosphotransferase [Gorillibacterium sp. CAU 1737]|uniref:phosphotransferase n=1 Tax=Gorillibacterium sp. CAU 1737 TaxID=3140362 RepID=UPI0032601DF8
MKPDNDAYYRSILASYPLPPVLRIEERDSGMNNTTRYAVLEDGSVRVLRIYENHREEAKLATEHELLLRLTQEDLPFLVPCPLYTEQGSTWTTAPDGKLASLFPLLPGKRPAADRHTLSYAYGRVVGQLTQAMEQLTLDVEPSYPPYDELLSVDTNEAAGSARRLYEQDAALSAFAGEADYLLAILDRLSSQAESIRRLNRQWIHGDFSHANALVSEDAVTSVLDFEFATRDLRAMELAVCLAEQLSAPGGLQRAVIEELLDGYRSVRALQPEELRLLPELLQLRKLDVFLHFLNRYQTGLDPVQVLQDQTSKSARVCRFLDEQADWIRRL